MLHIDIKIEGVTPLMMHRYIFQTEDAPAFKPKGEKSQEIAANFLHTDEAGKPVIPQNMIFAGIINAGRHHKLGKRLLTNAETSLVPGFVRVPGFNFAVQHQTPWVVDARAITNSSGSKSIVYRPLFPDWACEFTMVVDQELGAKLARELVDTLGRRIGIGAYRLERKGPFGAFRVVRWEVEKVRLAAE
jgi:hypothetical protein